MAFFFGKPYVQPNTPLLPTIPLGFWSDAPQVRRALADRIVLMRQGRIVHETAAAGADAG